MGEKWNNSWCMKLSNGGWKNWAWWKSSFSMSGLCPALAHLNNTRFLLIFLEKKFNENSCFLSSESGSEIERATSGQRLEIFGVPLLLFKHFIHWVGSQQDVVSHTCRQFFWLCASSKKNKKSNFSSKRLVCHVSNVFNYSSSLFSCLIRFGDDDELLCV